MSLPSTNSKPAPTVVKATLKALPDNGTSITVHFNPASLVYTVENSSPQQGGDPKRRQYAAQFTGKLTMDLQFDTTDSGTDVRQFTSQVAAFMQSSAAANKAGSGGSSGGSSGTNSPAPSVLSFDWGAYTFQGVMESFKETIDFFSADGIPLRSLVSIGLARQDNVFDPGPGTTTPVSGSLVPTPGGGSGNGPGNGSGGNGPGGNGPATSGLSTTAIATQGGDPTAARALASANNIENPRFTGGASLEVSAGIQLNPAVGFVASASLSGGAGISAGAGAGVSGGLGLSLTAGASAGLSVGAGVSASAGAGVGIGVSASSSIGGQVTLAPGGGALFGSRASAGVPATQGAFAGLEVGRVTISTTAQLNPLRMLPATVGSDVSAGAGASFGLGGIALAPTGFSTDVGANTSFSAQLSFDGD